MAAFDRLSEGGGLSSRYRDLVRLPMAFGVVFSLLIGVVLMALMFYSSHTQSESMAR